MTSTLDEKIDAAADRLQAFVEQGRREGGAKAKIADLLADDPEFLRKLKPSLIAARARGQAPTDQSPREPAEAKRAPSAPQVDRPAAPKPETKGKRGGKSGGPNPFLIIGAALAAGVLAAKLLDWRGYAHPRG